MLVSLSGSNKGEAITVTLDTEELLLIPKVANDNLYSDSNSWKTLSLEFLNPSNNQKVIIPFGIYSAQLTLSQAFVVSDFYQGLSLQFNRIIIYDKGNGYMSVGRSDVANPSLFDFTLTE